MSTFASDILEIRRNPDRPSFNYEFLIFLLLCGLLSLFFLLYFNRLFASIVSYAIRTWTWHKYRIYIDIGALQISLLGGRIFFTGLRYHGSNETFSVQHGYVTWRYWLRRVREVDIVADSPAEVAAPGKDKNEKLPCRINVNLIGVEWFVYNRSPAYDSVLAGLAEQHFSTSDSRSSGIDNNHEKGEKERTRLRRAQFDGPPDTDPGSPRRGSRIPNGSAESEKDSMSSRPASAGRVATSTRSGSLAENEEDIQSRSDLPFLIQFFPIRIECEKAAAVIGNETTKGIMVVRADNVTADVDASKTETVDPYRQVFRVDFDHPVIDMKENDHFRSSQVARATGNLDTAASKAEAKANPWHRQHLKAVSAMRKLVPFWRRRPKTNPLEHNANGGGNGRIPGAAQWQGLSRYLDDHDQDDKERWSSVEYAAETTLLDCPQATLNVYWDIVSRVTPAARRRHSLDHRYDINGCEAPAWGMHFSLKGGQINYGPWTDRRRADLQRVFFPTLCKDTAPASALAVGAWRVPTLFKLFIELEDTVTVKVPFREQSKNWRWRGQETGLKQAQTQNAWKKGKKDAKTDAGPQRPAAWLEFKITSNSSVVYEMDMLASSKGYQNFLSVDLSGSELRSTVNQDILWRSGPQRIECDLSNPLSWNAERLWQFDVRSDDLELYILRDHIFLLIDLIDDWSSGPPPDYLVFTPFKYKLKLRLDRLKLFINVNDANIIDKPTATDDNAYLILSSPVLTAKTTIPIDKYRPEKNAIPFDVCADTLDLHYHAPQWNTQSSFTASDELGKVQKLTLAGTYHYNASTSPANTDTLILSIHGDSPYAYLYGFVVRYFLLLKDNYFGDHIHFRTLDEYQEQLQLREQNPDGEVTARPPNKKSNDLDVILSIKTTSPRVFIPSNLYSSTQFIQGELSDLSVDLRFTNYYMDMELSLSPLNLSMSSPETDLESPGIMSSNTQLFVDGLRVFGHRLFGLPPTEPTYLCNWDVSVGAVSGECTADFLGALARGGAAFGFTFDDVENALVPYSSLVFDDVTFARVEVTSVRIWLHVDEAAFLLSTDAVDITLNDWARSHYSKRANINVPNVQISCVDSESAARHKARPNQAVETYASLRTDLRLATIGRKLHFGEKRRLQQELVRREDQRTNRTPFLLIPEYLDDFIPEPVDPPAQGAPAPPHPLKEAEDDSRSSRSAATSSRRSHRLKHQSSFLSLSEASTNGSVRRSRSRNNLSAELGAEAHQPGYLNSHLQRPSYRRDISGASSHLSAAQSTLSANNFRDKHQHSSVAFSSQYYAPHFALGGVNPDTREAPPHQDEEDSEIAEDDFLNGFNADLDDIDPDQLSEEHAYSSVLIELPTGVTAFVTPAAIKHGMALAAALEPTDPEDVLDALQIKSMKSIFNKQKDKEANGSIIDLLLKLPKAHIRFLNSSSLDSPDPSQEEKDQYDFALSSVAVVTRTASDWIQDQTQEEHNSSKTSLHLRLGSAEVSASERLSTLEEPQAAMMLQIDNVMVSVGAKDVTYFDADIGSIVGSTASGKVEYLASLIHRTGNLASELERLIEDQTKRHTDRIKYFAYRLLEEGHSTHDPSFLIRPSAVLRSAKNHIRTKDSWKLVMRLRQIWSTMDARAKHDFTEDSSTETPAVPPDAAELVIASFQRWRNWDLENIHGAVLLRKIFGPINEAGKPIAAESPLLGACRLGEMYFVLDPGPKENKMGVADVTVRVDKKVQEPGTLLPGTDYTNGPLTVLNICCNEGAINVNWELCELVDDIVRLYNTNRKDDNRITKQAKKRLKTQTTTTSSPVAFHVVLEIVTGSISVETVNLQGKSLSSGLQASALYYDNGDGVTSGSLTMNSEDVTTTLHYHSQLLGVFQLRDPTVFVSLDANETADASIKTVKSTATSQSLQFVVKEDPIALMEVVDLLLQDEIPQLLSLQKQFAPKQPAQPRDTVKLKDRLSTFRFNIALFLEEYTISIPLLQSLTYKISGDVARAACAANFGKELIFDFDIKENFHEMQIDVRNEPRSISLLHIPPTNGRVRLLIKPHEQVVEVLSSVELMQLDASAVYSLLGALNRPQISSCIEEVKEQSKVIQKHAADIFGSEEHTVDAATTDEKESKPLVYSAHLTFAGLQVSAVTPLSSDRDPISQVLFSLDKVHMQASNRQDEHSPILKYPEVYLNMKQIAVDILRGKRNAMRSCGRVGAGVTVFAGARRGDEGDEDWALDFRSPDLDINLSPETISTALVVLAYLREKIKDLDTSRELDYLRKLRQSKPRITIDDQEISENDDSDILDSVLSTLVYHFEMRNIRACWNVGADSDTRTGNKEDLVLSIKLIQFATRTKKSARLTIEDFQLQTVPIGQDKSLRSLHSALLPEVIFNIAYISTPNARRLAFQAVGQSLDIRLTSGFIVPAANLADSISLSIKNVQESSAEWGASLQTPKQEDEPPPPERPWNLFGKKRLESLLIDADFAGSVVHVSSKRSFNDIARASKLTRPSLAGKYGQFNVDESGSGAVLQSPGLAWKVEFRDNGRDDPTLSGEIKIDASNNILYPSVVPLILDIVTSVQEVVSSSDKKPTEAQKPALEREETGTSDNILTADPSAVLGRMRLNLGLRIRRQEFSLSCQPIARVAATACFDGIYFTANTVTSAEHGNFFAISGTFENLHASVQHVYSRESTGSFEIQTVTLSFMNSKHVSGTSGVSAILNISPMKVSVNAKQVQDFLLFREIWYPAELRDRNTAPVAKLATENSQGHLVQRYQQVAATAAFPWTATISIAALDVAVDLGQAIGKSVFQITDFWVSSKKTSDWEQNLCLGFHKIGIDCTGRLSGFVALQDFKLRTSIQWPKREEALNETPLVQASLGFKAFRMKAAFDYQAFLVADITTLEFLMYNVREDRAGRGDRLVLILDGEALQVFGTTTSASQSVALYQAIKKLIQERRENFESSLKEIEKFMKRKSSAAVRFSSQPSDPPKSPDEDSLAKSPISLDTDVVVTLKALNLGVFPSTFSDHQVFKMEALNAYARFAASIEHGRVHSILKMTLGQLRIGLAGVRNVEAPKTVSEISVDDVIQRATGSRGGTILKVPQVSAVMETWQTPDSNTIDYIFKSAFEGKVEVGWNYSRISYIRGMWANHSKSLEATWGRELPNMAAVKITGVPESEVEHRDGEQQKITAEVNVPQSKYNYLALEPPIIETPQLRDMGEATPPLEWIGLHRERLPNLTHQIVIVSLLELAGEVEDAYSRILGAS